MSVINIVIIVSIIVNVVILFLFIATTQVWIQDLIFLHLDVISELLY